MQCMLCNELIVNELNLAFIFSFKPYECPVVCDDCKNRFRSIAQKHCLRCFKEIKNQHICDDCINWENHGEIINLKSLYYYNAAMKDFFYRFKNVGDSNLAKVFMRDIRSFVKENFNDFIIVPIISSPDHLMKRGFDPVSLLFSELKLNYWLGLEDMDVPQAKKTRQERLNSKHNFSFTGPESVTGSLKILLVDDIYTTGTTLVNAKRFLKQRIPMAEIRLFTLVR